jgi:hypothetical protein
MFDPRKTFHSGILFVNEAGAYPSGSFFYGRFKALPKGINTQVYLAFSSVTNMKKV